MHTEPTQERTQNASTEKTRNRIHEAFLTLAESHDFSDISVRMVTEQAELNRTTFYLHYPTIDELIEAIVTRLLDEIGEGGRMLAAGVGVDHPEWHDTYFRVIGSRPRLYRRILASPGSSPLSERLIAMQQQHVLLIWKQYGFEPTSDFEKWELSARYCASGSYGATLLWLESGMQQSTEWMCEQMLNLMLTIARGLKSTEVNG